MAERNIGCTLCNFSRSQAAHSYELGDISRLGLCGFWSLVQALAALGSRDTGVTCIFVYFLSKCWGHSVLRRTVCLHKHSCQPLRPWSPPVLESTASPRQVFTLRVQAAAAGFQFSLPRLQAAINSRSGGGFGQGLLLCSVGFCGLTSGMQGFLICGAVFSRL